MILDLLPYKLPKKKRRAKLTFIRYGVFAFSFLFVGALFLSRVPHKEEIIESVSLLEMLFTI